MKQNYLYILLALVVFILSVVINSYVKPTEGFAFLNPSHSFLTFKPLMRSAKNHVNKYRRGLRNFIHGVAKKI
jgi:hypothetical protein